MTTVKFCRDCKHCMPEPRAAWNLRCMHPVVSKNDPWALSSEKPKGVKAREERKRTWFLAPCGMKGKLWEPKT